MRCSTSGVYHRRFKSKDAAGDSWSIPEKAEHGATVLKDAVVIEVFSPVREDFLPGVTERNPMGG